MSLEGHIENGVVVFDEPLSLPDGTPVRVEPILTPAEAKNGQKALPDHLGMTSDPFPRFVSDPKPDHAEFERLLDEMASMSTGKALPSDFSRADIYDDHD